MKKIEFKDYPNTTTPLNAVNLNQLQANVEESISANETSIENIESDIATIESDISTIENDISTMDSDITTLETNATNLASRVTKIENFKGIAEYYDGYLDANTTKEHLILTQSNTPNNSLYFVLTFFFSARLETSNRTQVAIPYNYSTSVVKNTIYMRYYVSGSGWTNWYLVANLIS